MRTNGRAAAGGTTTIKPNRNWTCGRRPEDREPIRFTQTWMVHMPDEFDDEERPRRPRRDDEDDDGDRPARRRRDEDDEDDRPARRSDRGAGMGIASLVLGILSLPLCICSLFDLPFSILAIVFGFVSRSQGGPRGTATAGIIMGFISLLFVIVFFILVQTKVIDAEQFKQMQMQNK